MGWNPKHTGLQLRTIPTLRINIPNLWWIPSSFILFGNKILSSFSAFHSSLFLVFFWIDSLFSFVRTLHITYICIYPWDQWYQYSGQEMLFNATTPLSGSEITSKYNNNIVYTEFSLMLTFNAYKQSNIIWNIHYIIPIIFYNHFYSNQFHFKYMKDETRYNLISRETKYIFSIIEYDKPIKRR